MNEIIWGQRRSSSIPPLATSLLLLAEQEAHTYTTTFRRYDTLNHYNLRSPRETSKVLDYRNQ